jgi:hypothetical protein
VPDAPSIASPVVIPLATQLLVWVVTTAFTGLVSFAVAWGSIRKSVKALEQGQDEIQKGLRAQEDNLHKLDRQRLECALASARNYTSRGEFSRLVCDQMQQNATVLARLNEIMGEFRAETSNLHNRITKSAEDIAALKALEKKEVPA